MTRRLLPLPRLAGRPPPPPHPTLPRMAQVISDRLCGNFFIVVIFSSLHSPDCIKPFLLSKLSPPSFVKHLLNAGFVPGAVLALGALAQMRRDSSSY